MNVQKAVRGLHPAFAAKLGAEYTPSPRRGESVGKARVRKGSEIGGPTPPKVLHPGSYLSCLS